MTRHWKSMPLVLDKREYSDTYHAEIVRSEKYRVIICRDDWQWVLQVRAGIRHGRPRWDSLSYCRDREVLIKLWTGLQKDVPFRLYPELAALPRNFRGRSHG